MSLNSKCSDSDIRACALYTFARSFVLASTIYSLIQANIIFCSQQQTDASAKHQSRNSPRMLIPNLPPHHYPFWLRNAPRAKDEFKRICSNVDEDPRYLEDLQSFTKLHSNLAIEDLKYLHNVDYGREVLEKICSTIDLVVESCWGYEKHCKHMYMMPDCPILKRGDSLKWFTEADFGRIRNLKVNLTKYFSVSNLNQFPRDASSLECTKDFSSCRGHNLLIGADRVSDDEGSQQSRSKTHVQLREIGGWDCDSNQKQMLQLDPNTDQFASWYGELKNYSQVDPTRCSSPLSSLAFFVKAESPDDLYAYFSTFINLYATMHLYNKFNYNNQIILWNREHPKNNDMWTAFTQKEPFSLKTLEQSSACFSEFIFALPAKSIDSPMNFESLIPNSCKKSGLINAFSEHVLHRLRVPAEHDKFVTRVSILSRPNAKLRAITNERDVINTLRKSFGPYKVQKIDYTSMEIGETLKLVHQTDILIGTHNDGLAYLLFLPEWASVIELNNLGDKKYENLAKMRGLHYYTPGEPDSISRLMQRQPLMPATRDSLEKDNGQCPRDESFCNFKINITEFLQYFNQAAEQTKESKKFRSGFEMPLSRFRKHPAMLALPENVPSETAEVYLDVGQTTASTKTTTASPTTTSTTTTTCTPTTTTETFTTTTTTTTPAPPSTSTTTTSSPTSASTTTTTTTTPAQTTTTNVLKTTTSTTSTTTTTTTTTLDPTTELYEDTTTTTTTTSAPFESRTASAIRTLGSPTIPTGMSSTKLPQTSTSTTTSTRTPITTTQTSSTTTTTPASLPTSAAPTIETMSSTPPADDKSNLALVTNSTTSSPNVSNITKVPSSRVRKTDRSGLTSKHSGIDQMTTTNATISSTQKPLNPTENKASTFLNKVRTHMDVPNQQAEDVTIPKQKRERKRSVAFNVPQRNEL